MKNGNEPYCLLAPKPYWLENYQYDPEVDEVVQITEEAMRVMATFTAGCASPQLVFTWSSVGIACTNGSVIAVDVPAVLQLRRLFGMNTAALRLVCVMIVAHETGHVVYRDFLAADNRYFRELRADHFSGMVAKQLGISENDIWVYVQVLNALAGGGSSTHPPGRMRTNAVLAGYNC